MPARFDSWDSYLWEPGGSVLRNLYGERDGAVLARLEYVDAAAQQFEIERGRIEIPRTYDAAQLCSIHRELFKNTYEWAGEYRSVGISKNASEFAHPADIDRYLGDAAGVIRSTEWPLLDREGFARAAAETFAYVNQTHPFREGNGRAAKLFMQQVSELSRWQIDYTPQASGISAAVWNQASMLSGPDRGRYEPMQASLVPVFHAMAQPRDGSPPPNTGPDIGRSITRLDYPRSATDATRHSPQGTRPESRSGLPRRDREQGYGRGE